MKTERRLCNQSKQGRPESAFTFVELLAVLGTVALLLAVAMPLLAGNRASSDRAVCQNNLRQIGRAFNMWADDHGGRFHYQVPGSEGGVNDSSLANNSWYQFLAIKAELETPKILACPTDAEKIPAIDWSNAQNGGFNTTSRRNKAISYVLGLGTEHDPRGFLSGDRNINVDSQASVCCASPAIYNVYAGAPQLKWQSPVLDWTEKLHNKSGNILRSDGSVISAGQKELRTTIYYASGCPSFSGNLCVLYPN